MRGRVSKPCSARDTGQGANDVPPKSGFLSARERRYLERLPKKKKAFTPADVIIEIRKARERDSAKASKNALSDAERRILVGARVRREDAERYRAAAEQSGRSLYRFVVDALEAAVR